MRNRGDVAKALSNSDWFTNLFLSHAALLIPSSHVHHSLLPRFSEDTAYPVHSGLRWCCFLLPPLSPQLSPPPAPHSHSLLTCPLYCFCICLIIIPASSRFPSHLGSRESRLLLLPAKCCTNTEGGDGERCKIDPCTEV